MPSGYAENERLDLYLTRFVENATRSKVQDGIKNGFVSVNGTVPKASYKVQAGDQIRISLPKAPPPDALAEDIPLDIVFEDDHLIIINKPAGMVVHPAFGNWTGTLVNALLHHTEDLGETDDDLRPGIVHRLDKGTTGLLVVAKTEAALRHLSAQFAKHNLERTYQAVVWGHPPDEGVLEGNLGRSPKDRKKMTVLPDGQGKRAVTRFRVLQRFDHLSLLEFRLETGRTHQIRVHAAHAGWFVFGDPVYGGDTVRYGPNTGGRKTMFLQLFALLGRQCLHAKTLGFTHPATGEAMRFDSDLPDDFKTVLDRLEVHSRR